MLTWEFHQGFEDFWGKLMFSGSMSVHRKLKCWKKFQLKKKTIMVVKEFEIKVFMDYMAMKRCIEHTQRLNTCKHSGQK